MDTALRLRRLRRARKLIPRLLEGRELSELDRAAIVSTLANDGPPLAALTDDEMDADPIARSRVAAANDFLRRRARLLDIDGFSSAETFSARESTGWAMLDRIGHACALARRDREILGNFQMLLEDEIDELADASMLATAETPADDDVPGDELTDEERAIGLLVKDSGLSIAAIARRLGVNRKTPYRWESFMKFWNGLKAHRVGELPRGEKDDDGIEAFGT